MIPLMFSCRDSRHLMIDLTLMVGVCILIILASFSRLSNFTYSLTSDRTLGYWGSRPFMPLSA